MLCLIVLKRGGALKVCVIPYESCVAHNDLQKCRKSTYVEMTSEVEKRS